MNSIVCELYLKKLLQKKKEAWSHQFLNDILVSINYSSVFSCSLEFWLYNTDIYLLHFHIFHFKKSSLLPYNMLASMICIHNILIESLTWRCLRFHSLHCLSVCYEAAIVQKVLSYKLKGRSWSRRSRNDSCLGLAVDV